MVREASITQEQVDAAATSLQAAGTKPTVRAVREKLGTGSHATVARLLGVWQSRQTRAPEAPLTLPSVLQRTMLEFIGQEVAQAKAQLAADLADLQQTNTDLAAEGERQAAALDELHDQMEDVQRERDAMAGRLLQLDADVATARQEAASERQAAEGARTELAKAQLRLEAMPRLEEDLRTARAELAAEREGRAAAEQAAAVARAQLEEIKAGRDEARAERDRLASQNAELAVRINELQERLAAERLARVREQTEAKAREQRMPARGRLATLRHSPAEKGEVKSGGAAEPSPASGRRGKPPGEST